MPEYSLNPLQDDCYENSAVLKNKFNIHDAEKLDIMEQHHEYAHSKGNDRNTV